MKSLKGVDDGDRTLSGKVLRVGDVVYFISPAELNLIGKGKVIDVGNDTVDVTTTDGLLNMSGVVSKKFLYDSSHDCIEHLRSVRGSRHLRKRKDDSKIASLFNLNILGVKTDNTDFLKDIAYDDKLEQYVFV